MAEYEYKHFKIQYNTLNQLDKILNDLGKEGWEISIVSKGSIFANNFEWEALCFGKRKIKEE